jgi:hypothetical protein
MPYILSTSYCPRVNDISFIDRVSFLDLALTSLRNLKSADKKHWHHRPIYRVVPCFSLSELDRSSLGSGTMGSRRSQKRNGQHCWRSQQSQSPRQYLATRIRKVISPSSAVLTYGRSGRHFVYAYKYIMYYIHLLEALKDRDTLRLIAPKIRKASTVIVNHSKVWEYLCTTYLRVRALMT